MKNSITYLNHLIWHAPRISAALAIGRNLFVLALIFAVPFASRGQSNQCASLPSGLVGWWSAEGNATDFTGAHSGTFPYGSAFAVGAVGQAFDFDGSLRRVSIPDSPSFQLTNAMTLEAWVYPRAYGGFITFRGDNRGGLDTWVIDTYDTGYVKFQIDDEANNYQSVRAPLTLNQWQHVAATWDRASGSMKIYLNGVLVQQTNTTVIPIGTLDSGNEPAIGIGNHGGTFHQFPFNGLVDELGIYDRALNANEIAGIFSASSAGKCLTTNPPAVDCAALPADVVSWWRAENNALDESGTNSGTLVGGMGYAAGRVGQAFAFDGVDDGVVIPDTATLNVGPGQDFTVEAWIRAEPHTTEYGVMSILSKRVAPSLVNAQGFELALHYGRLGAQLADEDDQFQNFISAGPDLIDGAYHHVAMTVNRAATNGGQLFVDGQVVLVFDPTQQSGNLATTAPFRIGKHASDWFNGSLKGRVDETAFYRRALAASEIAAIYNAGSAGKCPATNAFVPLLVNVDFGAGLNGSSKTGFAAIGQTTNDFWNYYTRNDGAGGWRTFGVLSDLKTANGNVTTAGLTVANAPGAWGNGSTDPMYVDYIYPFDSGNVTVTVTNLPAGQYDVLAYANDGNYEVISGGVSHGVKTTLEPTPTNPPVWTQGVQYARFTNVSVSSGQPLVLTVRPGVYGYAIISGMQIVSAANTNVVPLTSCAVPPSGLVSWWRGESNAWDNVGVHNGALNAGVSFDAGAVGQAFTFNGANSAVDLGDWFTFQTFSISMWVNPGASQVQYADILDNFHNENSNWVLQQNSSIPNQYYFAVPLNGTTAYSTFTLASNQWQHLVITRDSSNHNQVYVNGTLAAEAQDAGPVNYFGQSFRVGGHASNVRYWNGQLDELAVFNRALATNEIQTIYAAGSAGMCPPAAAAPNISQHPQSITVAANAIAQFDVAATGIPAPTYQWFFGNDPLANQTNAVLILSNVQPAQAGLYSVQVSNIAGTVFSSNAVLSVELTQPAWLVAANSPGFYNDSLGTTLDGTAPQFPLPFGSGGGDPEFYPAAEPYLSAGAAILGNWLINPSSLNAFWRSVTNIPTTWELNTETAIIYVVAGGHHGVSNLRADIDADNGIYIWVNGSYKFGARQPGLPSPLGQYEYTNVFLGELAPGSNYIQVLREDSGIADGYQFRLSGTMLATNQQPPIITQSPATQSAPAGNAVTFDAAAIGSPALTFQWQFNGIAIAGQTNTSLKLSNVQLSQAGEYSFAATNPYGSATSSVATLTVLAFPPVITRQPTNTTVIESATASFSVQATGSVTLAYQWLFNDLPLAGKTTATLSLSNVQLTNAGNYTVIVANPYGAVTSSVATLTVNPRPPCAPGHDGLVSWWRGENDTTDAWDSNNSASRTVKFVAGKVGQAFSVPFVTVPDAPSLRATNAITLEAWVNPSSVAGTIPRTIISKFDYPLVQPFGTQSAYLLGTTNNGLLFFTVSATGSARTNTMLVTTQALPINQWSHVAATYDGTALRIYVNGTQAAQTNYSGGIFPGAANLCIGGIPAPPYGTSPLWPFSGLLDEVSLYHRALSATEIQAIFAADLTGKCLAPPVITQQPQDQVVPLGEDLKFTVGVAGSRPLAYQWYFNGAGPQNRIIGATNASLLIEKVRTNNAGLYFVTVTNSVGSDFSIRAQLSTLPEPSCVDVLPGLISWWPGDGNFADAMNTNPPIQYSPATYPTGKVGRTFTFNGISSRLQINNSTSLNFGSNANFSIELWIKANPTNTLYPNVPLFEKRSTTSLSWLGYSLSLNQGRLAFAMGSGINPVVSSFTTSGPDLRDAMFHHVAVTINRANTNGGVLYVDGLPVLTFDPTPRNGSLVNTLPLFIGAPAITFSNSFFSGLIDEPAIYNRALTAAEILSLRTAGAAGRCKSGPVIVTQPVGGAGTPGQSLTLSVSATGTPLLRYQWRRNTANVAGATSATLVLTNVTAANAGTYSVIVSNAFGAVLSSNAVVVASNRPPVAFPGSFAVNEDAAAEIVFNATDPDGNPLSYIIVTPPAHGVLIGSPLSRFRTYLPNSDYHGPDNFTYKVNDGFADSSNVLVAITVRPVNDAPVAQSQLVSTAEDAAVAITLQASDGDGDALTYQVMQPTHGTLSGVAPNLIYTPETNYFGEDLFTFVVRDQSNAVSQVAVVGITVNPVNDAPVAKLVVSPLDELPGVTNIVALAPACCDATLRLDASESTDVENDTLSYAWVEGTNVLATGVTVTNRFKPGTHEFTLLVSDGTDVTAASVTVEIITPPEAVAFLKTLVEEGISDRRHRAVLLNWLRQAGDAFERCHVEQGVHFLELFQQRVQDRVAPADAALAKALDETAAAIIEAAPDCDPCHRLNRPKHPRDPHHREEGRDHNDNRRSQGERPDQPEETAVLVEVQRTSSSRSGPLPPLPPVRP